MVSLAIEFGNPWICSYLPQYYGFWPLLGTGPYRHPQVGTAVDRSSHTSPLVWCHGNYQGSKRPMVKSHFHPFRVTFWSCYFTSRNLIFLLSKIKIIIAILRVTVRVRDHKLSMHGPCLNDSNGSSYDQWRSSTLGFLIFYFLDIAKNKACRCTFAWSTPRPWL